MLFLFSLSGHLLDATKQYMYVFLLAGCEVVLSALILAFGNFFCIRTKKQKDPEAKMEMAVTAAEKEVLNSMERREEEDEEEPSGIENGKADAVKDDKATTARETGDETSL